MTGPLVGVFKLLPVPDDAAYAMCRLLVPWSGIYRPNGEYKYGPRPVANNLRGSVGRAGKNRARIN